LNISIIYGGTSAEHKISIQTGLAVAEAIKDRYNLNMVNTQKGIYPFLSNLEDVDLIFNAMHGGDGENGTIQAYLNYHHIAYTGSGSKASKIAMDKNISKLICKSVKIPTPNWMLINRDLHTGLTMHNHGGKGFTFPIVVKPSNEGSTYGLSIVHDESKLPDAVGLAAEYSNEILVEEYIKGRELTVSILGNKTLPIIEITPSHDLYDFECKYNEGMSEYTVPAELSDALAEKISSDALKIYNTIGCRHYARVDFRLNEKDEYYFLEINTLPGMTRTSLMPKAAAAVGLAFPDLINTIIEIAILEE